MNSKGTILVIDDDSGVRQIFNDSLSEIGYEVSAVGSPCAGLDIIKKESIDLIITDIMMPEMSGIDFLRSVRSKNADLPVVMITGHPSVDVAVQAMKEGASDFISKPFNLAHARLVIKKAMEEGRLRKENKALLSRVMKVDKLKPISKKLSEKVRELSVLYSMSEALHRPFNTSELLEKTVEIATGVTYAKRAGLWMFDMGNSNLLLKASHGMKDVKRIRVPIKDAGLINNVIREKRYVFSEDYKDCICGEYKEGFRHPFLCVPIIIGKEICGILHLCEKIAGTNFTDNDVSLIENLTEKASLKLENLALYENLIEKILKSVTSLVKAIDARDNYTMNHCRQVTLYAIQLAQFISCPDEVIDALRFAGPIHDVGKIGVRDGILLKPGFLEQSEKDVMESHVIIGDKIIRPLNLGSMELAVVRNHHERFDGSGYPDKLKGEKIPLVARIFSVADTYDAMTTNRPYRTARSHEEAVKELKRCRGTQFDGDIVDAFVKKDICKDNLEMPFWEIS